MPQPIKDSNKKRGPRSLRRELYAILFVYFLAFLAAASFARGCASDREQSLAVPSSQSSK